ncbi:glycosyltransferase family 2 protein [Salinibacter ruber]|uniref:Glycosyltransferase 2-like domain-containing protein n=1 Tax=Salinibacter ruber TaxID=146919 RepID=A0AAW5P8L5_9BACT|nr:glycosyltransferase [Salinibacter ruber]MCS4157973.1 hypothetical protein [Salinibacter ruber]
MSIGVSIKTGNNRVSIITCIHSVINTLKEYNYKIYIGDQPPISNWKSKLYNYLLDKGHFVKVYDEDRTFGEVRNKLASNIDEKYLLRIDDDFELGGEFNIEPLRKVLESNQSIDFCSDLERQIGHGKNVVSGRIRPFGANCHLVGSTLFNLFHSMIGGYRTHNNYKYKRANFTRNLLLIRRNVLADVKWDPNLMWMGEHLDFMLSLMRANCVGAYTPHSIHYHRDDLNSPSERGNLPRNKKKKIFSSKWGIKKIVNVYPPDWYAIEVMRRLVDFAASQ